MDKILKTLNINQPKITIKPKKEKIFNKVKNYDLNVIIKNHRDYKLKFR